MFQTNSHIEILLYFVQPFFHSMAPGAMLGDRNHSAGHDQIQDGPGKSSVIFLRPSVFCQMVPCKACSENNHVFPNFPIHQIMDVHGTVQETNSKSTQK